VDEDCAGEELLIYIFSLRSLTVVLPRASDAEARHSLHFVFSESRAVDATKIFYCERMLCKFFLFKVCFAFTLLMTYIMKTY
jgi:hypothetical protein